MSSPIAHIFRKDVRRLWREIAIATAILAAFVWVAPRPWVPEPSRADIELLRGLLHVLVPIGWIFLIVRLVQEENLVGDRQFWITRPYEWKRLLVEKLLFMMVFINLPLFIAQVALLMKASFVPSLYLGGLVGLQILWILILILPALTLGTITSGIGQAVLVVLGTILCYVALGSVPSGIQNRGLPRAESLPEWVQLVVIISAGAAVVLWQYARRMTVPSRGLLLGAVVVAILLVPLATPYRKLIARAYPHAESKAAIPVHLAFDSQKPDRPVGYPQKKKAVVAIPLVVSGVSSNSLIRIDGTLLTIVATGGPHWNSGWQGGGEDLFPNSQHAQEYFAIDKDFFERVKTTAVSLRMSFALSEFQETEIRQIVVPVGPFSIPGDGHCLPRSAGEILCLFPLRTPFLLVSTQSNDITCPPRENEIQLPPGITGYGRVGYRPAGLAEFGINPVQDLGLSVRNWGIPDERKSPPGLCPGTPLSVGILEEGRAIRTELQIDTIKLIDYEVKRPESGAYGGATGFGIAIQ
jgi:hypothetical protein